MAVLLAACASPKQRAKLMSEADSLVNVAKKSGNYERMLALTDSLESESDLNDVKANVHRVRAYYSMGDDAKMEVYARKVIAGHIHQDVETYKAYTQAVGLLADVLQMKGDEEGALKVALPVLNAWKENPQNNPATDDARSRLFPLIGLCQVKLGNVDEGERNLLYAYQDMENEAKTDSTGWALYLLCCVADVAVTTYNDVAYSQKCLEWMDRYEQAVIAWSQSPDGKENADEVEFQWGRLWASAMRLYRDLGDQSKSDEAYRKFLTTNYAKTAGGQLRKANHLMATKRFQEAADLTPWVDSLMEERHMDFTLENVKAYLGFKFRSNYYAGRRDKALEAGLQMADSLSGAVERQKKDAAAKLATIYETQEKERTIADQQATLSRQREMGMVIAFGLVTLFLIVYTLYRRKSQRRLAVAHEELQVAYDQLEQTTTAKERIESELRIARDIQMSMVPHVFPERKGLDLYATMTPARQVGGDLYDYLLSDGHLYFCLGDVSGKGVPASLFMAQTIRLFRALAKQQMMPAQIATRLNDELTEGNDSGMFVTMFIGLVDLTTGHLDYCNAGHNPPVVGGDEQGGHFLKMIANAPIGLWPDLVYEGEEIDNIKGKPLFVYSDGLNEAENSQQEQFGDDRLLSILQQTHFDDARQVIEALLAEVERHRCGAEPNDDLTMMCLRID